MLRPESNITRNRNFRISSNCKLFHFNRYTQLTIGISFLVNIHLSNQRIRRCRVVWQQSTIEAYLLAVSTFVISLEVIGQFKRLFVRISTIVSFEYRPIAKRIRRTACPDG